MNSLVDPNVLEKPFINPFSVLVSYDFVIGIILPLGIILSLIIFYKDRLNQVRKENPVRRSGIQDTSQIL